MADRTIKVVTSATNFDLLTLDEAKLLLGISATDTSHDAQLTMMITVYSQTIAELCNRTFAKETVIETWREMTNGRLFLSHWPVKETDITTVTAGTDATLLDSTEYELEESSGKVSFITTPGGAMSVPWDPPAVVSYTGGFDLPDEAPMPLKQATALMIMEARMRLQQAQVAGIRQISHKESRIAFFDPNALLMATLGAHPTGVNPAIVSLLQHYIRIEV